MADLAGFRARFPEFEDPPYTDTKVLLALSDASLQINPSAWGYKYDLGIYYLAAHMLAFDGAYGISGGAFGNVTSESVGEISRSYGSYAGAGPNDGYFTLTKYGLTYLRLKSQIITTPIVL